MPWLGALNAFRRAAKQKGHFDIIFRASDFQGNHEILFQAVKLEDLEELAQAVRARAGQVSFSMAQVVPFEAQEGAQ